MPSRSKNKKRTVAEVLKAVRKEVMSQVKDKSKWQLVRFRMDGEEYDDSFVNGRQPLEKRHIYMVRRDEDEDTDDEDKVVVLAEYSPVKPVVTAARLKELHEAFDKATKPVCDLTRSYDYLDNAAAHIYWDSFDWEEGSAYTLLQKARKAKDDILKSQQDVAKFVNASLEELVPGLDDIIDELQDASQ